MTNNKWQRFKQGMRDLTPEQFIKAQLIGNVFAVIGLCLAFTSLCIRAYNEPSLLNLGYVFFVAGITWLQYLQYNKLDTQLKNIKKVI